MVEPDMMLPAGKTCGDCSYTYKCRRMFGCRPTNTTCDFSPSRFHDTAAAIAKQNGKEGRKDE